MAGNVTGNPAIATPIPAIVDAMTLCEVIILTNPIPIHSPIPPRFPPDPIPHYIIPRRSDPVTL
jgi:hypothetical protein